MELGGSASLLRHNEIQKDERRTYYEDRQRMAEAPDGAHPGGLCDVSLAADYGTDGDHVVGIGGVAHSKKETESDDRDEIDHEVRMLVILTKPQNHTAPKTGSADPESFAVWLAQPYYADRAPELSKRVFSTCESNHTFSGSFMRR